MEQIKKSFQENRVLVFRSDRVPSWPLDAQVRSLICLPIDIDSRTKGVLFHSNTYLEDQFSYLDNTALKRLSRYLGESITFLKNRRETADIFSRITPLLRS